MSSGEEGVEKPAERDGDYRRGCRGNWIRERGFAHFGDGVLVSGFGIEIVDREF